MSSAGAARTQWDLMQNPKRRIFRWRFDEEEEEKLIASTPREDSDSLLNYMSNQNMYRKLAYKIDNTTLGIGDDNFSSFKDIVHSKWEQCHPGQKEGEFNTFTRFAFEDWLIKYVKDNLFIHLEISSGISAGIGSTNVNATASFGIGFDSFTNIALYGNLNLCLDFSDLFEVKIDDSHPLVGLLHMAEKNFSANNDSQGQLETLYSEVANNNFILGWSKGTSYVFNVDFWGNDITDLFGPGTTYSGDIPLPKGYKLSVNLNYDGSDNFFGVGVSPLSNIADGVCYSKTKAVNRGLVIRIEDYKLLSIIFNGQFYFDYLGLVNIDNDGIGDLTYFDKPIGIRAALSKDGTYYITETVLEEMEKRGYEKQWMKKIKGQGGDK